MIKNWRPISLLNVDVKIASKALALRLANLSPEIIQADQYAYVKGSSKDIWCDSHNWRYLTIILRNRAEYRLILSRRG